MADDSGNVEPLIDPSNTSDVVISGLKFDDSQSAYSTASDSLIGSGDVGDISNLQMRDCRFINGTRNAIMLQSDSGTLRDI